MKSLHEYDKLFDGCMRYDSNMSEEDIRCEIVRLLGQKENVIHDLSQVTKNDIDFVRCSNRKVKSIDGDVPFDSNGINQVYKNGGVYARINNPLATNRLVSYTEILQLIPG